MHEKCSYENFKKLQGIQKTSKDSLKALYFLHTADVKSVIPCDRDSQF